MSTAVETIPLANLALAFIPAAVVVVVLHIWSRDSIETLFAFARMVLQLALIGYFLVFLFDTDHAAVVMAVLGVMVLASSWIALRTAKDQRKALYSLALAAIFIGGGSTLIVITQGVLNSDPWYAPRFLVPLAGMIFAASMNSVSLAAERVRAELGRGESYIDARSTALHASLIPITNALFAVGLVSLPGMMTGQILSGVSPLVAARYQIMVMCMMFAASGLSASLFLLLARNRLTQNPSSPR